MRRAVGVDRVDRVQKVSRAGRAGGRVGSEVAKVPSWNVRDLINHSRYPTFFVAHKQARATSLASTCLIRLASIP